jgi:TP901 family phage tail tape measure protein
MAKNEVVIKFTGETGSLLAELGKVSNSLDGATNNAIAAEQALQALQKTASVFGGVMQSSLKNFAGVEQALTQTSVLTGTAKGEMSGLGNEVLRLAQATSKTPREIAAMTTELGRAGFTAEQQTKALSGIVSASEATGESLQAVGKIAGTTLQVFGLLPEESQRVADVLTQVANASMTSVTNLGKALRYVGGTARQNNQSLEDTTILIGLLADKGIDASVAGTNLRRAINKLSVASAGADSEFNNLVRGGGKASEAFKAIGATARNADGTMRPLLDILPEMQAKMQQLSEGDRQILVQALFGTEGGNAMLALLGTTTERIEEMRAGVDEAVASQRSLGDSKAMMDNLAGSWEQLGGSVETVSVQYGMFLEQGVRPMIDGATKLVNVFGELPPVYQKLLFASATFTGILITATAAIAAYNIAKTTQIALEIKAAAATVASALSFKGLAISAGIAADATLAFMARIAPLLAKMALIVGAAESLRQAYLSVARDGGEVFKESTNSLRKELLELEMQTGSTAQAIETELKPAKRSWTDFFGQQARREVNQAKIAVRDFRGAIGDTIEAAKGLGDSAEDTRKKQQLFAKAQEELNKKVEALDENQLGTEAYRELRAELEVSQNELNKWAGLLKVNIAAGEENAQTTEDQTQKTEDQTKAIEDQTEALDKQIEALRGKRDAEKEAISRQREDQGVIDQRKREDEDRKRQETQQDELNKRQKIFDAQSQAAQEAFAESQQDEQERRAKDLLELQRQREDDDRKAQEAFDKQLRDEQKTFELTQQKEAEALQKRLQDDDELFAKQQQDEQKAFNKSLQAEQKAFTKSQQDEAKLFNEDLEREKDDAAKARQAAEKALADEIAGRLEQQAAAFGVASTQLDRQAQLFEAVTEEEKAALAQQFKEFDRIQKEISQLDLAGQVFSPDELIRTAKDVANISQIKTAEDAKKLQEVLGQIEAEQRRQQAEADKLAQEQLRLENEAAAIALQDQIETRQEAFRLKQETAQETFRLSQETAQELFQQKLEDDKDARQERRNIEVGEWELQQQEKKEAFETALDQRRADRELALIALKRQREDEDRAAQQLFEDKQEAEREEFEARMQLGRNIFEEQQRTLQENFTNAERQRQRDFEDAQRKAERAFNDAEREKDLDLANKIKAIEAKKTTVTNVIPRFAGGPVVPGRLYLGGENNPEPITFPNGKTAMVGLNGPELFRVSQPGMVHPSVAAMGGYEIGLLSEVRGLREDMRRSPMSTGNQTYNIVTAENPLKATIKLQQEAIRSRARLGRL